MALFKYMLPDGVLRFLTTWSLRVTPPDQFNDPFEMKPPIDMLGIPGIDALTADRIFKEVPRDIFALLLAPKFQINHSDPRLIAFISLMLDECSELDRERLIRDAAGLQCLPPFNDPLTMATNAKIEMSKIIANEFKFLFPVAEREIHSMIPRHIGALCMTRKDRHPLLWAHYADEHRGAVVEYDESAPCFNRKRSADDDFGSFRAVTYSRERPQLRHDSEENIGEILMLTKAAEWAYEDEVRMLWPLAACDKMIDGSIHLVFVPPAAVVSVTLGCRASVGLVTDIQNLLQGGSGTEHIAIRKAVLDAEKFALNYVPI